MRILHAIPSYFHVCLNIMLQFNLKVKLVSLFFTNLGVQLTLQEQMLYLSNGYVCPMDDGSATWICSYTVGSRFNIYLSNGSTWLRWHVTIMNVNSHIYILTIIPPTWLPPKTITRTAFTWDLMCARFCANHFVSFISLHRLYVIGTRWLVTPFYEHGNQSLESHVFTVSHRW